MRGYGRVMPTFRTTDDVALAYTDEGSGPAVVLVHGFTAPATAWILTVDALLAAGHRVVTFDRRAHGESETPSHGQRMARHGRDLGELLEHLDLSDVALVGASMGGNTLWAYVDQFGPARLSGVVVVDQTPKMLNDDTWPHGFYGYEPGNAATFFDHGVPQLDGGRTVDRSGPAVARLAERLGGFPSFRDSTAPETLPLLRDHALADWRDVVRRFPLPLLMVAGRESQVWSCEHAEAAVAGTAHGRALVIEDAGHAVSIDQPDRFNEVLLEFLGEVAPR
ncbi:Pimeloyl-ACP methyl ester carboxylesterase [Nocardioides exalbidus]|uniref:Pimeloyl-ACP methyl ester carboxylesterase n=2 Tax=Nocardioides exalbidus TaxID=402596 RepID=A0A1H4TTA1_9ACTN|nr:Pimeloyl-ACP methyl ester carboxylesterase [Nocardioides exalbidus]